jgi:hypothetical protein
MSRRFAAHWRGVRFLSKQELPGVITWRHLGDLKKAHALREERLRLHASGMEPLAIDRRDLYGAIHRLRQRENV